MANEEKMNDGPLLEFDIDPEEAKKKVIDFLMEVMGVKDNSKIGDGVLKLMHDEIDAIGEEGGGDVVVRQTAPIVHVLRVAVFAMGKRGWKEPDMELVFKAIVSEYFLICAKIAEAAAAESKAKQGDVTAG